MFKTLDEALSDGEFCEALDNFDLVYCYAKLPTANLRADLYNSLVDVGENPFHKFRTIVPEMFKHTNRLTSVNISDDVQFISDRAFEECKKITDIHIDSHNYLKIDMFAFSACDNLKTIDIVANNLIIDYMAFAWCSKLERITIHGDITGTASISQSAFLGCDKLVIQCKKDSRASLLFSDLGIKIEYI